MKSYLSKMQLQGSGTYQDFASDRAKLAWVVYAGPNICLLVAKLAQATQQHLFPYTVVGSGNSGPVGIYGTYFFVYFY